MQTYHISNNLENNSFFTIDENVYIIETVKIQILV